MANLKNSGGVVTISFNRDDVHIPISITNSFDGGDGILVNNSMEMLLDADGNPIRDDDGKYIYVISFSDTSKEKRGLDLGEKGYSGHIKTDIVIVEGTPLTADITSITADSTLIDASDITHTADEN